jgi:biopolymer transport protein ExbD
MEPCVRHSVLGLAVLVAASASCKAKSHFVAESRDAGSLFTPPPPDDPADAIPVTLTKTQLLVEDEVVLPLPARREDSATRGVDARYKRSPLDPFIVPLQSSFAAKRAAFQAAHGKPIHSAVVIADGDTPYRLLVEVLFTLGQAEVWRIHLMVLQRAGGATDGGAVAPAPQDASPLPPITLHDKPSTATLGLAVAMSEEGIAFKTTAGPLGAGCVPGAPGITVPRVDGAYDLEGARRCARALKAGAKDDTSVLITATFATRYADVIALDDALRADGNGELFPVVSFGMPR